MALARSVEINPLELEAFKTSIEMFKHQDGLYWARVQFLYVLQIAAIGAAYSLQSAAPGWSFTIMLFATIATMLTMAVIEVHRRHRDVDSQIRYGVGEKLGLKILSDELPIYVSGKYYVGFLCIASLSIDIYFSIHYFMLVQWEVS